MTFTANDSSIPKGVYIKEDKNSATYVCMCVYVCTSLSKGPAIMIIVYSFISSYTVNRSLVSQLVANIMQHQLATVMLDLEMFLVLLELLSSSC